MTNYSDTEIRQIAAINHDAHLGLLTACGISRTQAGYLVNMTVQQIEAGLAQFAGKADMTPVQSGFIAAAKREITIQQGA